MWGSWAEKLVKVKNSYKPAKPAPAPAKKKPAAADSNPELKEKKIVAATPNVNQIIQQAYQIEGEYYSWDSVYHLGRKVYGKESCVPKVVGLWFASCY